MITLTDAATTKVAQLIQAEGEESLALRVAVRPGGCSGFAYEMFFDTDVAADDLTQEFGDVRVVVRSNPSFEWDTGLFAAFGLELKRAALVFVKSPAHFRVAFGPHAARILVADTPGPTCGNMRRLKLERVTRPLYPIDWNDQAPSSSNS